MVSLRSCHAGFDPSADVQEPIGKPGMLGTIKQLTTDDVTVAKDIIEIPNRLSAHLQYLVCGSCWMK